MSQIISYILCSVILRLTLEKVRDSLFIHSNGVHLNAFTAVTDTFMTVAMVIITATVTITAMVTAMVTSICRIINKKS